MDRTDSQRIQDKEPQRHLKILDDINLIRCNTLVSIWSDSGRCIHNWHECCSHCFDDDCFDYEKKIRQDKDTVELNQGLNKMQMISKNECS